MPYRPHPSSSGFTLIEVLVAVTITSILLVALFRLFSEGISVAGRASAYDDAAVIAESTLESLGVTKSLQDGATLERDQGRFHISATIHRYSVGHEDSIGSIIPYELAVTVSWQEQRQPRAVALRTLRLGSAQ